MKINPLSSLLAALSLAFFPFLHASTEKDGMTLVWSDEFDYTGLPDPQKWRYDVGGHGWGNNELQYYTDAELKNARVGGGVLTIEAIKETVTIGRATNDYTSARLVSNFEEEGSWLYGRFDIRARLPQGRGTWPAIWMLPSDWAYGGWPESGEIDIMEHVGYDMNRIHATVHTEDYNHMLGTQVGQSILETNVDSEFHLYSLEWRPHRIDAFLDGQVYFSYPNDGAGPASWPFDQRFHLLLNIAVGGNWGGAQGIDESIFPQSMEIDFVRVYQFDNLAQVPTHSVPGQFEAEDFSAHAGVRMEATQDLGGGLNVGWLGDEDWLEYTIDVEFAGTYEIAVRYASPNGEAGLTFSTPHTEPLTRMFTSPTGGWQDWETETVGQIELPAGETTLRLDLEVPTSEDLNVNWVSLNLVAEQTWAGFPVVAPHQVDTGSFLGLLYTAADPWVYAFDLEKWILLPSDWIHEDGAWVYMLAL